MINHCILLLVLFGILILAGCGPADAVHQCTVTGSETVQVYETADSASKVVDTLAAGEVILAQGKAGDYRLVTTPRLVDGYILDRLCK